MDLLKVKMITGTALGVLLGTLSVLPATAKPANEVRETQPIAQTTPSNQMENNSDIAPEGVTNDNLNNDINTNDPTNQNYDSNQMENNSDIAPRDGNRNVNDGGSLNNPNSQDYNPNQMENNSDVDGTRLNNPNNQYNDINRTNQNNINNGNNVDYNDRSMQQEYEGTVESYDGTYLQMRMSDGSVRTFMVNSDELGENANLSPGQNVVITTQSGSASQVQPTYPALW